MEVRESTDQVDHPSVLWEWSRVDSADHPSVAALYQGAPDLGWTADPRLCLYRNNVENCYILVRRESDEEYRLVIRSPRGELISTDSINRLIKKLIAVDRQRGFDPIAATLGYNEKRRLASEANFDDYVHHEVSDRLVYWATHSYLPQIDVAPKLR